MLWWLVLYFSNFKPDPVTYVELSESLSEHYIGEHFFWNLQTRTSFLFGNIFYCHTKFTFK